MNQPRFYIPPPQTPRHKHALPPLNILTEIKAVIPSWINPETGEIITPKNTQGGTYFNHTPTEVTKEWVEHVKQLHEIVTMKTPWAQEELNIIEKGFKQLTTQYSNLVEYHEMTYQLNRKPFYTNHYNEQERQKLEFDHFYLEGDLARFEYTPVATLLEVEVESNTYVWAPVKPEKLTRTQHRTLPKNK